MPILNNSSKNPFFNNYSFKAEQEMLQDLIVEAISQQGHEVFYIPRNINNLDQLYLADDQSSYTTVIPTIVHVQSIDGFDGAQNNIFTKFQLEIRDSVTVSMARREYERKIEPITNKSRPEEGDLIYFTMNKKCFVIRYTNNKELFYELGELPTYQMSLDLFEYSGEQFNTGIPEIDSLQKNLSLNAFDYGVLEDSNGEIITNEQGGVVTIEKYDTQNILPDTGSDAVGNTSSPIVDTSIPNRFGTIDS